MFNNDAFLKAVEHELKSVGLDCKRMQDRWIVDTRYGPVDIPFEPGYAKKWWGCDDLLPPTLLESTSNWKCNYCGGIKPKDMYQCNGCGAPRR